MTEQDFFIKRNALDHELREMQEHLISRRILYPHKSITERVIQGEINGIGSVRRLLCKVQAYTINDIKEMKP